MNAKIKQPLAKLLTTGLFGLVTYLLLVYFQTEIPDDMHGIMPSIPEITPCWTWLSGSSELIHWGIYSFLFQIKIFFIIMLFWLIFKPRINKIIEMYIATFVLYALFYITANIVLYVRYNITASFYPMGGESLVSLVNFYQAISLSLLTMIAGYFFVPVFNIKNIGKLASLVILSDITVSIFASLRLLRPVASLCYGQIIFVVLAIFLLAKTRPNRELVPPTRWRYKRLLPWIYAFIFGAGFFEFAFLSFKYFFTGFLSAFFIGISIGFFNRIDFHRRFLSIFLTLIAGFTVFGLLTAYSTPLTPLLNFFIGHGNGYVNEKSRLLNLIVELNLGNMDFNNYSRPLLWRWPVVISVTIISSVLMGIMILKPYFSRKKLLSLVFSLVLFNIAIGLLCARFFPLRDGSLYVSSRGPLDMGLRVDSFLIIICLAYCGYLLGKAEIQDCGVNNEI